MQRREFLAASAAAALGVAASARGGAARVAAPTANQWIELRTYHFASPEKLKAFEDFFERAAAAALGRAGVEPAGAFKLLAKDNPTLKLAADPNDLYVLLPHPSAESVLTMQSRLAADEAFREAGASILKSPKSDPAYSRYESSLMLAFDHCPRVEAPTKAPGRVLQLRIYESHNEERARKKIQMFNEGGEIEIFRRCGINPVFFGESLAGSKLPNLTYMVAFEDEAAQKKAWDAFRADAEWKKLSGDEAYKDTVSNITNLILRPAAGSQV